MIIKEKEAFQTKLLDHLTMLWSMDVAQRIVFNILGGGLLLGFVFFIFSGCQIIVEEETGNTSKSISTDQSRSFFSYRDILSIPTPPSKKWTHIIIHHSATNVGSLQLFEQNHRQKGWNSVGYHFIICNGSAGKKMGEIEVTSRWFNQQDGAHCRADNMNSRAIGICLVGNFDETGIPREQFLTLVHLTRYLQQAYNIPKKNIIGHGQVSGANTHCPGQNFPWVTFYSFLY